MREHIYHHEEVRELLIQKREEAIANGNIPMFNVLAKRLTELLLPPYTEEYIAILTKTNGNLSELAREKSVSPITILQQVNAIRDRAEEIGAEDVVERLDNVLGIPGTAVGYEAILARDAKMMTELYEECVTKDMADKARYRLTLNRDLITEQSLEDRVIRRGWKKLGTLYGKCGAKFESIKSNKARIGKEPREWILRMEAFDQDGKRIGWSYVGADNLNSPAYLLGILNIAFAGCNIKKASTWNGNSGLIIDFINRQYRFLARRKKGIINPAADPKDIVKRIRTATNMKRDGIFLWLPPIRRAEPDRLLETLDETLTAV